MQYASLDKAIKNPDPLLNSLPSKETDKFIFMWYFVL